MSQPRRTETAPRNIAILGAGMAGIACARTLVQAGHAVTVFDKSNRVGGRMASRASPFGTFDHGAQYFTVRDARFDLALQTTPHVCKAWSANSVRLLDAQGRVAAPGLPPGEPHWVPTPSMRTLLDRWAKPLADDGQLELGCRVTQIERDALDPQRWQLRTEGEAGAAHVYSGFDAVLLALPAAQAQALLNPVTRVPAAAALARACARVDMQPCWALMVAYPQAVQPGLTILGPQWNAARSTHHRIAWMARESSKPGRGIVERWTVHANWNWSQEHIDDSPARVQAKLLKAFAEVTGIRAQAAHAEVHRWRYARAVQPLGQTHLWDAQSGLGVCGDWCLGHRVENAFISGLELALAVR